MGDMSSEFDRDFVDIRFPIRVKQELVGVPVIIIAVHKVYLGVNVMSEVH
jgi:hypothetical protein